MCHSFKTIDEPDKNTIMESGEKKGYIIKLLDKDDRIPYDLLLLADETKEAIDRYIFESEIYVLEQEKQMIAVYVLQPLNRDEIEIKNIAVSKDHQGKGIGKYLLKDAKERARVRGFQFILIGTADVPTKQLYLYQKEGFEIFSKKKNFFMDHYPEPIYENGVRLKDMIMLRMELKVKS